jgi:hypothetical protein
MRMLHLVIKRSSTTATKLLATLLHVLAVDVQ